MEALDGALAQIRGVHVPFHQRPGGVADENSSGLGQGFQPGGIVHGVAQGG